MIHQESPVTARLHRLKGRRESLQLESLRLEKSVGIAKARQEHKEVVEGVLDDLERRFHERSMGILESLLGAFLNDVLPRGQDMGEQSVQMSLDTQRGLPALQVAVRNGEQVEDALRGRGGSVANVLSAGLRFIAIARTGGRANTLQGVRPFLVLDEADCWLSPDRVPAFSGVIHSLTYDLGVQVLMISHHDTALLKGFPVHLERIVGKDGFPSVRVRHITMAPSDKCEALVSHLSQPKVPPALVSHPAGAKRIAGPAGAERLGNGPADSNGPADEIENGKLSEDNYTRLTGIRLENFLSHEDSLIPLTAGVTVLTGDNDVGKSAVTEAFRAIAYNDSSDAVIRHGASEARVSLLFADGTRITWVRVRKGSPKTSYQLFDQDADDPIRETPAPKEVPEWVRMMLGMDLREKMDVHIGDQKSPVFLLDQPPSQRAAILDIGRESQHLRTLRERWKHQVDEDRRTIREGEKQLAVQRRSLAILVPLDDLEDDCTLYGAVADRTTVGLETLSAHRTLWILSTQLQESLSIFHSGPAGGDGPPSLPDVPKASDAAHLNAGLKLWMSASSLRKATEALLSATHIEMPDLPDPQALNAGIRLFASTKRVRDVLDILQAASLKGSAPQVPFPEVPAFPERFLSGVAVYEKAALAGARIKALAKWSNDVVVPTVEDIQTLGVTTTRIAEGYRLGKQILAFRKSMNASETELAHFTAQHDQAEKDYQEKLQEFGTCPFCSTTTSVSFANVRSADAFTHHKDHH